MSTNVSHPAKVKDIAIIGMKGRFPGAPDLSVFWENLSQGLESVTVFQDQELLDLGVTSETCLSSNYVKARPILDDEQLECFDAAFWGFNPREASWVAPQHRLFLESAWEVLESAGYDPARFPGAIGVYAGTGTISMYLWNHLLSSISEVYSDPIKANEAGAGLIVNSNVQDALATLTSYKLNLRGPSVDIQSFCSTSLLATHIAVQSLRNGECDMALAGGVHVFTPQRTGQVSEPGGIISADGHCRAFDAEASGLLFGNGVGVVVIKRLEDALRDGDRIFAVIKGSAAANDGADKVTFKPSFTAPGINGQAAAIWRALADSGVRAETIQYMEAHATGTRLGDPTEVVAATKAFRQQTDRTGFCAIGSVKSNIGHLDAASGITGLIKTVLMLQNRQILPTINVRKVNPLIDFSNSPFYLNTKLADWPRPEVLPRRAGVSSFGFGGTNVHVVLEEAPEREPSGPSRAQQLFLISTKTATALDKAAANLAQHLSAQAVPALGDVAFTLAVGRAELKHRRAIVAASADEAVAILTGSEGRKATNGIAERTQPPVVFMFPGQGAQHVNMGRELYEQEPVFRASVDRCAEILQPHLGLDLRTILYPEAADKIAAHEQLTQTWITQPALFVIEYGLAQLWLSWGIKPEAMIGHSVGEYVAATLSGVFSLEDGLGLLAGRSRLMQALPAGSMLAVMLSEAEVLPLLNEELSLAAVNGPQLCTVSGSVEAVAKLQRDLENRKVASKALNTSHGFHSAMMNPIAEAFTERVKQVKRHAPQIPYLSNVTSHWITAEEALNDEYWFKHLRLPVRFADGIAELAKVPERILLEVGPSQALSALARRQLRGSKQVVAGSLPAAEDEAGELAAMLTALGKMWANGVTVDWSSYFSQERRQRVDLPTYPFERKRYWIEPVKARANPAMAPVETSPKAWGDWFSVPSWKRSPLAAQVNSQPRNFLLFADDLGVSDRLAQRLRKAGQTVTLVQPGRGFKALSAEAYVINPQAEGDYHELLKALRAAGRSPAVIAHLWTLDQWSPADPAANYEKYLRSGFESLFYLAKAVGDGASGDALKINVITNGMAEVLGGEPLCPEKAVNIGPCRVMPLEYGTVKCALIDVELTPSLEELLVPELVSENSHGLVAYRGGFRWVESIEAVDLPAAVKPVPQLKERGVYFITGGLGGIGLSLGEYLAEQVKARLVLVARKGVPERAQWTAHLAQHSENDQVSQRIRAVEKLERKGAEVLVLAADVADAAQMQQAVTQAKSRFGAINGVIHSAGVAGGGIMQLRTMAEVRRVLDPKVKGTQIISRLLPIEQLDFFVLCSSTTALFGEAGQVDYCSANAYLDLFAQSHQKIQRVHSINWYAWAEVGMAVNTAVPDGLKAQRAALLAKGIKSEEGKQAFERVLTSGLRQVVVSSDGSRSSPYPATAHLTRKAPKATLEPPNTGANPLPSAQSGGSPPPADSIEQKLTEMWQQLMGIEKVGIRDDFFELGGHSLLGVQLMTLIKRLYGLNLPLATLIKAATVESLAAVIRQKLNAKNVLPTQSHSPVQAPRLFCLPPSGGNALVFREIALTLGSDIECVVLQPRGLEGVEAPFETFQELAAYYLENVRRIQPIGPYHLIGTCAGGIIAYELARQLADQGEQMGKVILLDAWVPPINYETGNQSGEGRASRHLTALRALDFPGKAHYILTRAYKTIRYVFVQADRKGKVLWAGVFRKLKLVPPQWHAKISVFFADSNSWRNYRAGPYAGKATILWSNRQTVPSYLETEKYLQGSCRDGLEVVDFKSPGEDVLQKDKTAMLAAKLRELLKA